MNIPIDPQRPPMPSRYTQTALTKIAKAYGLVSQYAPAANGRQTCFVLHLDEPSPRWRSVIRFVVVEGSHDAMMHLACKIARQQLTPPQP